MYRYAISVPQGEVVKPAWQEAVGKAKLKRIEFSCTASAPLENLASEVDALLKLKAAGVVEVGSVHVPFGGPWNFSLVDDAARASAILNATLYMNVCKPLGSKNYTIHGSCEPIKPEDRSASIAAIRKSLEALMPVVAEQGATLNVEILPRTCLGNTAVELAGIIEGFPKDKIGVCFDVNHLCGHPEMLPESIALLGESIRTLHISDYDGVDECHWYPGMGVIDWAGVMAAVKKLPNDVLLMFESSDFLKTPAWQSRGNSAFINFRAADRNIFYLENAAELQRRIADIVVE